MGNSRHHWQLWTEWSLISHLPVFLNQKVHQSFAEKGTCSIRGRK